MEREATSPSSFPYLPKTCEENYRPIINKTVEMLAREEKYGSEPIEHILYRLRFEEKMLDREIVERLDINRDTLWRWMKAANIESLSRREVLERMPEEKRSAWFKASHSNVVEEKRKATKRASFENRLLERGASKIERKTKVNGEQIAEKNVDTSAPRQDLPSNFVNPDIKAAILQMGEAGVRTILGEGGSIEIIIERCFHDKTLQEIANERKTTRAGVSYLELKGFEQLGLRKRKKTSKLQVVFSTTPVEQTPLLELPTATQKDLPERKPLRIHIPFPVILTKIISNFFHH